VERAGGQVLFWNGHRVMGVLAMSRAIGDHCLRPYIIPDPEITVLNRCPEDELLLLASDGLWDVMSCQEASVLAVRCLEHARRKGASHRAAARVAASVLTKAAIDRGSRDNVTVVVVDLRSEPEPYVPGPAATGGCSSAAPGEVDAAAARAAPPPPRPADATAEAEARGAPSPVGPGVSAFGASAAGGSAFGPAASGGSAFGGASASAFGGASAFSAEARGGSPASAASASPRAAAPAAAGGGAFGAFAAVATPFGTSGSGSVGPSCFAAAAAAASAAFGRSHSEESCGHDARGEPQRAGSSGSAAPALVDGARGDDF